MCVCVCLRDYVCCSWVDMVCDERVCQSWSQVDSMHLSTSTSGCGHQKFLLAMTFSFDYQYSSIKQMRVDEMRSRPLPPALPLPLSLPLPPSLSLSPFLCVCGVVSVCLYVCRVLEPLR